MISYSTRSLGIFFGSCAPSEKYLGPKQSSPISHNGLKKDGAQLLLSKQTVRVHKNAQNKVCPGRNKC